MTRCSPETSSDNHQKTITKGDFMLKATIVGRVVNDPVMKTDTENGMIVG